VTVPRDGTNKFELAPFGGRTKVEALTTFAPEGGGRSNGPANAAGIENNRNRNVKI